MNDRWITISLKICYREKHLLFEQMKVFIINNRPLEAGSTVLENIRLQFESLINGL